MNVYNGGTKYKEAKNYLDKSILYLHMCVYTYTSIKIKVNAITYPEAARSDA